MKLFNHANQEVQRHATGAMRNLVYDNADNKLALVEENGIFELLRALREQDDELRKNVTGGLVPTCYPTPLPPNSRTSHRLFPRPPWPFLGTSLWSQPPPQGPCPQGSSFLPSGSHPGCPQEGWRVRLAVPRRERSGAFSLPPEKDRGAGGLRGPQRWSLTTAVAHPPQGSCGTCPPATT